MEKHSAARRSSLWLFLGGIFFLLLIASTIARFFVPSEGELGAGQKRIEVPEFDRDDETGKIVQIAYRDLPPLSGNPDAPVIVLIHGSPVGSVALKKVYPLLQEDARVIVPDLPGFGGSTIDIKDYSTRAGAYYTLALLDTLGIEQAYFVGYSMGGGVILNIADIAPQRVEGLVMGSAIGVQEHELLGDYTLNHGLHWFQLMGLWSLQNLFPHFGYMDHGILNVAYARNFYDTDQRPFRSIIEKYDGPMLILHGEQDRFVPPRAAAEHAMIAQKPEMHWLKGGHLQMLRDAESYVAPILNFVKAIESKTFDPQTNIADEIPQSVRDQGYGVMMVLLALGTQVAEDFSCIIGGVLASRGVLPYWAATVACAVGIFIGDMLLYLAGYFMGAPALKRAPLKWFVSEASVNRMAKWYHRRGALIILLARFVPGLRLPCYVAAGVLRIPLQKFLFYFIVAVFAWTPILVGIAYMVGDTVLNVMERYERFALLGLVLVFVLAWLFLRWIVPLLTWRGRRLVLSRWKRMTSWEFWPLWAMYIPIGLYITWHGLIKYRCAPLFTAVNPGIPNGGGLAGEAKSQILENLKGAGDTIARWVLLKKETSLEENLESLKTFINKEELSYPIVLKPDLGERGQGVAIVKKSEEARSYLEDCLGDTIAQEFVPGCEFGVFYYRYPGEETGHILGITDKRFPSITGDGASTLERLILMDNRAVCMAKFFLDKFENRLDDVLESGEKITLTDLGTHCRGSLFLDGSELSTPATLAAFDEISRHFDGFWFGRYDVRVPSETDLAKGKNIKVIELNGLSSEATYIYDPKHSYWFGLKTLAKQWRIAFKIASLNRKAGHKNLSTLQVFGLFFDYRSRDKFEA
ncbi:alpha/beta fold hydrolase [Rubellicoccus peritrichatus]|uniref:Alpha/beta fold hydrolase n=1 Tax=Rubellicoccus peritrichatus TaxID=3080537 RepID=A0AAQ3QUM2_9BACT|nr:alpha/beta fold hydrolase [Puniceicoccus sp. CR14]WOO40563.1 alpha/beta fold hydrolase [Puniceicoccus sp. CR14]